jgi:hypothetical protein
MRLHTAFVVLAAALTACESPPTSIVDPPPPTRILLKDIEAERLPSPYYHFTYDASGRVTSAAFASGLRTYRVDYDGDRITDMATMFLANNDSLQYGYDDAGRVTLIKYLRGGQIRAVVFFEFSGTRLTRVERDVRITAGYIIDKTVTLSYDAAGNLRQMVDHRPAIDGLQGASTTTDTFEDYDDGINVDDFALLHDDFFDELFLLPDVKLQHGNPRLVTRTGDGANYVTQYTYTYDVLGRPVSRTAAVSAPAIGYSGTFLTAFSYY